MPSEKPFKPFKYLTLHGTRTALVVSFTAPKILLGEAIQGTGKDLLRAVDMAARIDMPLTLSFQGVENISSALIGKIVLLNKKAKTHGVKWSLADMSPEVEAVFRRTMGDNGSVE